MSVAPGESRPGTGDTRGRFSEGEFMATKITRDVLESYLRCQRVHSQKVVVPAARFSGRLVTPG